MRVAPRGADDVPGMMVTKMAPAFISPRPYEFLLGAILTLHLAWILWVILGALLTGHRPLLGGFHVVCMVYGVVIEVGPWPCPLTLVEQWARGKAGVTPYTESFLVHYLGALVYPDVSPEVLVWCASAVGLFNLSIYGRRICYASRRSEGGSSRR